MNMNYLVQDGKRGHVFATMDEAVRYANEYQRKTGEIIGIIKTKRKATHKMPPRTEEETIETIRRVITRHEQNCITFDEMKQLIAGLTA